MSDKKQQRVPEIHSYEEVDVGLYHTDSKGAQDSVGQHPSPEAAAPTRLYHVSRFYPWEIGSVLVAFGMIAATYSILSHYDGHQIPEWPFSINLNTLIALISTIMRAAMLVGVTAVISQTKWSWFSRPRPLMHLQYFDEASRSVSGSLSLLFVAPTSLLGILGALITILSLGIGPFTQQTIRTVGCLRIHDEVNASLPLAHFVPGNGTYYRIAAGMFEAQVDMKGTMINGIVNPTGNDTAIIPTCATGNCTFPHHNGITHSSIAMCSSCIDTTSLISGPSGNYGNYTLPNKLWVAPVSDMAYFNIGRDNMTWASSVFTPEFASVSRSALINVTVLSLTTATCSNDGGKQSCPIPNGYGGPTGLVATSCSLYPCLKNYDATMERGVLSEKVVSTQPAPINYVEAGIGPNEISPYMNYTALQTPCRVDDEWFDLSDISSVPKTEGRLFTEINIDGTNYTAPDECLYKMMSPYAIALSSFMGSDLLSGTCTYNSRQGQAISCGQKWWLSSLYQNKEASFDTLNTAFDQFATAVTNKFRTTGSSLYDSTTHETVNGLVNEVTVCTVFQWEWLLMPTLLVAATAAILVVIILENKRHRGQPVWKSSLLPLLYYGFDHKHSDQHAPNKPAMNLFEMNQAASEMKATFRNGVNAGFVDVTDRQSLDYALRQRARDADVDSLIDRA
ncbi:ribosome-binding protein [Hypoxylon texense]